MSLSWYLAVVLVPTQSAVILAATYAIAATLHDRAPRTQAAAVIAATLAILAGAICVSTFLLDQTATQKLIATVALIMQAAIDAPERLRSTGKC